MKDTLELYLFVGPMFVNCQNFAGLWRRNFICWFVALQCKTIHYFVKCSCGHKFVSKGTPRNPWTLNYHDQWWFHSISFKIDPVWNSPKIYRDKRYDNKVRVKISQYAYTVYSQTHCEVSRSGLILDFVFRWCPWKTVKGSITKRGSTIQRKWWPSTPAWAVKRPGVWIHRVGVSTTEPPTNRERSLTRVVRNVLVKSTSGGLVSKWDNNIEKEHWVHWIRR